MVIFYCDKCKKRVLGADAGKSSAVQIEENKWLCDECAPPIQALAPQKAMPAAKMRRNATARIPRTGNQENVSPKKPALNLILFGAAGCMLLAGVIILLDHRSKGENPKVVDTGLKPMISNETPSKSGVSPAKPSDGPISTSNNKPAPPSVADVRPAPNQEPSQAERARQADKEMEELLKQRAARLLEEYQAWFKQNPTEAWQYRTKLHEVAASYRSTPAAVEARRIMDELKLPVVTSRFVRIENLGKNRILSLAEVQVFSDGNNVARGGKASQSSVDFGGVPERAIDGNTDGNFFASSTTHTAGPGEDSPWWEVDLGGEKNLEGLVIWNRTDMGSERLKDFRIAILNKDRAVVWSTIVTDVPSPKAAFDLSPR